MRIFKIPISYFNFSSSATPIFVSSSQRFIHRSVVWPDGDGTSLRVHCKQRFLSCTAFSVKEVVRVALCGVVGLLTPRFSWGVLTLSLPECLIEFCEVTLTFESVDEILWCDHSNERPQSAHGESHALNIALETNKSENASSLDTRDRFSGDIVLSPPRVMLCVCLQHPALKSKLPARLNTTMEPC